MIRIAALLTALASGAHAQSLAETALAELSDAQAQLSDAATAPDRIAALTKTLKAFESSLSAMRAAERDVAGQEAALALQRAAEEERIANLAAALSTISRTPQAAQRAYPGGPVDTVRAGMLLAGVTPAIQAELAEVTELLAAQARVRQEQAEVTTALQEARDGIVAARDALANAVGEGAELPLRFVDDPVQSTLLAAGAESLGVFVSELAATRPDPEEMLGAAGNLPLPVSGLILPDDGSGRPGVRIATSPRALVTTPVTATVLFQGPLLDYGNVVILEPAPDVLFVFAGLNEVFAQTGQIVTAETPIGLMPDDQGYDDGILTENLGLETGQRAQALYLEVREGQTAVQTDAWFALE